MGSHYRRHRLDVSPGGDGGAIWRPLGVTAFWICYGRAMVIPLPMVNILIGFVITYIVFIVASIMRK